MMRTQRLFVVLLASIVGMLLFSGVASAGNCCDCLPGCVTGANCTCYDKTDQSACEVAGGVWVGDGGCETLKACPNPPYSCIAGHALGKCTPEITTIALLGMGLLGIAGYLRFGRRRSKKKE